MIAERKFSIRISIKTPRILYKKEPRQKLPGSYKLHLICDDVLEAVVRQVFRYDAACRALPQPAVAAVLHHDAAAVALHGVEAAVEVPLLPH